jgi:serine/threonine protein kinase
MKKVDKYLLSEEIGHGMYGIVLKCEDIETRLIYACKQIPKSRIGNHLERLKYQVEFLKNYAHPYLVQLHDARESENNYYLILELVPGGSLDKLLKVHGSFPEVIVKKWVRQIIECMIFLNERRIVHRDMKPANILLTDQDYQKADIKIVDFDLSKKLMEEGTGTRVGTPLYIAPEVLRSENYDYRVDVWSLGCTMYELLTGRYLFQVRDERALIARHERIRSYGVEFEEGCGISQEAQGFIRSMLVYDKEQRPMFSDLIRHSYLTNTRQEESVNIQLNDVYYNFRTEFERNSSLIDNALALLHRNVFEGYTLASLAITDLERILADLHNLITYNRINSTRFNTLITAINHKLGSSREALRSLSPSLTSAPYLGSPSDQILRLVTDNLRSSLYMLNLARSHLPENSSISELSNLLSRITNGS